MDIITSSEVTRIEKAGFSRIKIFSIIILFAGYLFQMISPLRLNPDVIAYLSMASSAAEGKGFLYQGNQTHYPIGYPLILLFLSNAGIGASWAIIGLNCLFMAIGLAASFEVLVCGLGLSKNYSSSICCITLLSSVFINNIFMPMSDAVFFGASMICILIMIRAQRRNGAMRWITLTAAATLIVACTLIRTVGIALVPPLIWVCLLSKVNSRTLINNVLEKKTRWIMLSSMVAAVLVLIIFLVTRTMYFRGAVKLLGDGWVNSIIMIINYRAKDWGELVANMRIVTLPAPVRIALKCLGLFAFIITLFSIWLRRYQFGIIEVYVSTFILIIWIWPYTDGRFWIPVIPLLMGLLIPVYREAVGQYASLRLAAIGYLFWFILMGVVALAITSRDSMSEPQYGNLPADQYEVVKRFSR